MAEIQLSAEELRPLLETVVSEVHRQRGEFSQLVDGRLVFSEAEAAAMLGWKRHQLRDLSMKDYVSALCRDAQPLQANYEGDQEG